MKHASLLRRSLFLLSGGLLAGRPATAQTSEKALPDISPFSGPAMFLILLLLLAFGIAIYLSIKAKALRNAVRPFQPHDETERFQQYTRNLSREQLDAYLKAKEHPSKAPSSNTTITGGTLLLLLLLLGNSVPAWAQSAAPSTSSMWSETGIIITLILLLIPIVAGMVLMGVKIQNLLRQYKNKQDVQEGERFARYLSTLNDEESTRALEQRKRGLDYQLTHTELAGEAPAEDRRGLIDNVITDAALPVVSLKKKAQKRGPVQPELAKLILWFLGTATFWLLFGTTVGEYLGIKFVSPDADHISWLSFGRLRPVHTNAVFWGWASLAMLGLGYYVVPRVGNNVLASIKKGWYTLILINAAVVLGTLSLMAGINNGGGEYREYIWPIMLLFGIGLALTLVNFLQTIARRKTKEIYIANWYIVAAVIFAIVIAIVAYVPLWQDGLGETIIQGYYMHQGVGMWFMLFTLGIVYYFLPQQLNKPIYSYSLGILAFWAQILFYTVIGTHHFVFSAIPWWLQTTAIVGSMGMVIPVVAGATNFIMTFKGSFYKVATSYTLPFFLVGIIFYFTGSLQGTAEAFRSTNLMWHFTDFTVAHSHLTMYGIICFFLWAGIYALVPRITGKEAPQITVGAHFWLALIGMLIYTVPLMYGSTLRGLMWMAGKPFTDSVVFMAPYWLWRAIGGSLMWLSHGFFAYNMYRMIAGGTTTDVREVAVEHLNQSYTEAPLEL